MFIVYMFIARDGLPYRPDSPHIILVCTVFFADILPLLTLYVIQMMHFVCVFFLLNFPNRSECTHQLYDCVIDSQVRTKLREKLGHILMIYCILFDSPFSSVCIYISDTYYSFIMHSTYFILIAFNFLKSKVL